MGTAPQPPLSWLGLTEAQAGLWYAQRLDPQNPVFNTGLQMLSITTYHIFGMGYTTPRSFPG